MPVPRPPSREYRIYLALWRKAWLQPDGAPEVSIKAPNLHMAVAIKQGMYRAIKPYRYGEQHDHELQKAVDKFVLYLKRDEDKIASNPHWIVLRERKALTILEIQWAELGLEDADLLVGDERTVNAKLDALIEKQEEPVRTTPFYEREE